jgi:hypothetical protein
MVNELVTDMREHVEDANAMMERWIEVFDMKEDDAGKLIWDPSQSKIWDAYAAILAKHNRLVRDWNKFVGEYNATVSPRNFGRPLQASPSQVQDVRRLRKDGKSLRGIVKETSLSLRTVRKILDQGSDRERTRANVLRRETFDRMAAADFSAKRSGRDYLEKRINRTLKEGTEFVKAAKGLGIGALKSPIGRSAIFCDLAPMPPHDAHGLPIAFGKAPKRDERQRKLTLALVAPVAGVRGATRDRTAQDDGGDVAAISASR